MASTISKDDKEAALNARIAAIRAANETREKRHREIEADRRLAEKTKSAITSAVDTLDKTDDDFGNPGRFKSSFTSSNSRPTRKPGPERLTTQPRDDAPKRGGRGRLSEDDGPPPDPGYSFLADRMRDGEFPEDDNGRKGQHFAQRRPAASKRDWPPKTSSSRHHDENTSPKHRPGRTSREEPAKAGFPAGKTGSAQARLDRGRRGENGESAGIKPVNRRVKQQVDSKKLTVEVQFDRDADPEPAEENPAGEKPESQLVATTPSWTPAGVNSEQWNSVNSAAPAPTANEHEQWTGGLQHAWQPASGHQAGHQMIIGHWDNADATTWPAGPQQTHVAEWTPDDVMMHHYHAMPPVQPPPPPPSQFMHIPFQAPANNPPPPPPLVIPMAPASTDYHLPGAPMHPPQPHPAMTQITHASQHAMPIMATQQFVPRTQTQVQQEPYYNNRGYTRSTNHTAGRSTWKSNSEAYKGGEVTRIPPRFQKQKPAAAGSVASHSSVSSRSLTLPRATSSVAPAEARRLTIFGTSNVVNNLTESALSAELGLPVRLIPAMKLEVFREKIGLVDPNLDRVVLIHGLGNDARNIALKSNKSDVDKGAESDAVASEFADLVLDLVTRIPYLRVLISTLLPRFDNEDQVNMSNPNNVRKVMNVEISMRLRDRANVGFVNNDSVLEWWKDDVKKLRLFGSDGYHLSAYGFSIMLGHWMKTIKATIGELGLGQGSSSPDTDESETKSFVAKSTAAKSDASEIKSPATETVSDGEISSGVAAASLNDANDEDDEFHEASESPVDEKTPSLAAEKSSPDEEFKEKENEEKMEKELTK